MKKIFLLCLLFSLSAFSQNHTFSPSDRSGGGGNGGDYIRMKFMAVGNFILQNYKQGLKEIESLTTVEDLRGTLNIDVIKLSDKPLVDNGGSKVDAIGEVGRIILYEAGWEKIFSKADLIEKLVLHEMLRAVGVNDDNYHYSTLVLGKYDISQFDQAAYIRWCSESASFLESALKQGILSKTSDEELLIYKKALAQIEPLISPKHFYFIAPSVIGAQRVMPLFKSNKSRVNFLRVALKQIANDIRYIDSQLKNANMRSTKDLGDNAKYASNYLQAASRFTILAETSEIETEILNVVFDQVYAYMVNSDYARVKYGAVFSELDSARNTPVLSYKRQALQYLRTLLK